MNLSKVEIMEKLNMMIEKPLTKTSHLYDRFPGKTIGEAVKVFSCSYDDEAKKKPGLVLLSVILAAHRNYTKQVEPIIKALRKKNFDSFQDLKKILVDMDTFGDFIGAREHEKYTILVEMMKRIDKMKSDTGVSKDYDILHNWAANADYTDHKRDIIGQIKGIGIATFQHLRMNFGINTVKPDQRVAEVLNREFNFISNNLVDYIEAVEYISMISELKVIEIDQIFVNYGSGYYTDKSDELEAQSREYRKIISINTEDSSTESTDIRLCDSIFPFDPDSTRRGSNKLNNLPKGSWYTVEEFIKILQDCYEQKDNNYLLLNHIISSIYATRPNVLIEKRGDGFNIVPRKLKNERTNKNAVTIWVQKNNISLIIIGKLDKKSYRSVEDLENSNVVKLIVDRCDYLGY